MIWTSIDTWIVLTGVVISLSCALVGNFLVVRRMSLMGDAISHAVLPGLAMAFLIGGTRNPFPMFIGAVIAGLGTAFFTEWIHRNGKVEESSAMGVVFTTLFALGLVLIVQAADKVDLDPGCVLYGAIELSPLDTLTLFGADIPRSLVIGLGVLIMNSVIILLFYKEFKITAFDPEAASALGIPARRMYYLLMAMVAITAVASFESVGSILVIAMLIVPGAAAQFVALRLGGVIRWSLLFAALSAVGGHIAAVAVPAWFGFSDTSTSGSMAVVTGLIFTACFLFAPNRGWISRVLAQRSLRHRIIREDILGSLYRWQEENPPPAAGLGIDGLVNRIGNTRQQLHTALSRLQRQNLLRDGDLRNIQMTEEGQRQAATIIRDHRLWETFLHEKVKLPADHVHATSEKLEHITDDKIRRDLERAAGGSSTDPHGKVIP
jgi:manganese/zinc/iron transport system permease protein